MEFWLDTIAHWEQEKHRSPFVALSCTKNVQDAILTDSKRSGVVDIIDFRYWWRKGNSEFAPPGGKNLSPRQFERRWRGGRPGDEDLARMVAEYRTLLPTKAITCDFDSAGWAWECAGGPLPRLPQSTDPTLLEAIPRMKPWFNASQDGTWILREAGKQFLLYLGDSTEIDLAGESGAFRIHNVSTSSGTVSKRDVVEAGQRVRLPRKRVLWLTKE